MTQYDPNTLQNAAKRALRIKALGNVPIIFANGRDCDLTGIRYAMQNKRVNFDGRIYEPGEDITITGRKLMVSCRKIIMEGDAGLSVLEPPVVTTGAVIKFKVPNLRREVSMWKCIMEFGLKVEP